MLGSRADGAADEAADMEFPESRCPVPRVTLAVRHQGGRLAAVKPVGAVVHLAVGQSEVVHVGFLDRGRGFVRVYLYSNI